MSCVVNNGRQDLVNPHVKKQNTDSILRGDAKFQIKPLVIKKNQVEEEFEDEESLLAPKTPAYVVKV